MRYLTQFQTEWADLAMTREGSTPSTFVVTSPWVAFTINTGEDHLIMILEAPKPLRETELSFQSVEKVWQKTVKTLSIFERSLAVFLLPCGELGVSRSAFPSQLETYLYSIINWAAMNKTTTIVIRKGTAKCGPLRISLCDKFCSRTHLPSLTPTSIKGIQPRQSP